MNIIGRRKIFLTISSVLVGVSILSIVIFGFRLGIDFAGGTLWQISFSESSVDRLELHTFLEEETSLEDIIVTPETSGNSFIIRTPELTEEKHQEYREILIKKYGAVEELRFDTIGAAVGREVRDRAVTAFILVLIAISLYIAFAFRKVSKPVSSWKYGAVTLITLFHDAVIPAGLFALLGYLYNIEIDTNFIVAILVIIGFSVHDTIVVFDRIRENVRDARSDDDFKTVVNNSVNQTIARSINTSFTLLLVLIVMYLIGAQTLQFFVFTISIGTIVGTYSSIFVASPLLSLWKKK